MSSQADSNPVRMRYEIGQLFTPATPINEKDLFSGRIKQVNKVIDAVNQRGQHAILYGERGVGKTSLSNVLAEFFQGVGKKIVAPRVMCHSADSFADLWRRVFAEITADYTPIGLNQANAEVTETLADVYSSRPITPDAVREALASVADKYLLILIVDEFDRLTNQEDSQLFADTIKTLSDYAVKATLVLVGVADTVDQLISGHESVQRNLVQIPMPRMSEPEIHQIFKDRLPKIGMTITEEALSKICAISRGLPHYAHLLGQHSAWEAISADQQEITAFHVGCAMKNAIENSQQSVRSVYHEATMSPRKDNLFTDVLLACALAACDEFGYFAAADVREPMSTIKDGDYDIPRFAKHLKSFCEPSRGSILSEIGDKYQRRFRFSNTLMQPYVIIRGLAEGKITLDQLNQFPGAHAMTN